MNDQPRVPRQRGITPSGAAYRPPVFNPVEFYREQARQVLDKVIPTRFAQARPDDPKVQEWVRLAIANIRSAPSLLLAGPTGTGKTHQGWGAVRAVVEALAEQGHGLVWKATSHPDMNAALRPKPDGSDRGVLDALMTADLIFLDDLGAGKQTEWTGDSLYRLVDHRWSQRKPSIFSTNLNPGELVATVGDRVVSRLGDAQRVAIKGSDRRWAA